jgi:5'-methylthioadenosine phosphorylase
MMKKDRAVIAVIGGSGLYEMKGVSNAREVRVKTPFGRHSEPLIVGELGGVGCAFLPRHGKGHVVLPSEINARANIYALKSLGVERIVAVGAVGSLKEELGPGDLFLPDQLVDETKGRASTFFGGGLVAHVAFDRPFCPVSREFLIDRARESGMALREGGVHVCMEGPAFSTKAESEYHRRQGYSVIGMTSVPESKLAREAEICYALINFITDYDCWKEGSEVSQDKVLEYLALGAGKAKSLLEKSLPDLARLPRGGCSCIEALKRAIVTDPKAASPSAVRKLDLLVGKYLRPAKPAGRRREPVLS